MTGASQGGQRSRSRSKRDRRGERFTSYYNLPVLNKPTWEARDIAGYLFLGGLAGGSAVVAAAAQASGRASLRRTSKLGAAGAIALSLAALVHDLGRPARFFNMLRVVKVTSPMNLGSWLLAGFAPASFFAAASELTGWAPTAGAAATIGAAGLGPAVAAYTAALVANTAVPAWHDGFRQMPFVFVSSGATAAAGLGMLGASVEEAAPVRRLALIAAPLELASSEFMKRSMDESAEPFRAGLAHRYERASQVMTAVGVLGAATVARRSRLGAAVAGAGLLMGSAAMRFAIFHAGVQSAEDPRYTVIPQRKRLDRKRPAGEDGA